MPTSYLPVPPMCGMAVFMKEVWGVTRSLFNYLVPMLQDKRAEEEETEGEALGLST
jgi:hypothetical protein